MRDNGLLMSALVKRDMRKLNQEKSSEVTSFMGKISDSLIELSDEIKRMAGTRMPETSLEFDLGVTDKTLTPLVTSLTDVGEKFKLLSTTITTFEGYLKAIAEKEPEKFPQFPKFPEFPKTQKVIGDVKVSNQISLDEVNKKLDQLITSIQNIKFPKQKDFPKINIPDTVSLSESKQIIKALIDLKHSISEIKFPEIKLPKAIEFPKEIAVTNFPPQKYPMPVTHMSINALAGEVKTRSVTVTTDITPLPGEVLANRRSILVYNNSDVTIEIGGSTFTFGEGLPVAPKSFSPPLDAGSRMIIYGRVSTGTANVRTFEISDLNIGR